MRAVQVTEFGGPEVLKTVELPEPTPGPGEVLIEVDRAGINYADTHQAENTYLAPSKLPLVPGGEVVGRTIGGDAAFDYSPVLRKARDDGLRWDVERLEKFLADPAEMFPGLWMSMRGIEDAGERKTLVRFLADPSSR